MKKWIKMYFRKALIECGKYPFCHVAVKKKKIRKATTFYSGSTHK